MISVLTDGRFALTIAASLGISLFIESTQLPLSRTTDVDDLILNTAGALIGYGLYRLILLCAVMVLSACLTGCKSNEPNFPVALSDTTRSAFELCTKGYKDTELDKIYQFMLDDEKINAKKLHDKYEIQCLRKDDDGYAVYYIGNTRILLLRFNEKGEWVKRDRLHSMYRVTETRGKFDALKEGDNVTKVQSTDPVAYFPFLADPSGTTTIFHPLTTD